MRRSTRGLPLSGRKQTKEVRVEVAAINYRSTVVERFFFKNASGSAESDAGDICPRPSLEAGADHPKGGAWCS